MDHTHSIAALIDAIKNRQDIPAEMLVADLDQRDEHGKTALYYATREASFRLDTVELLIAHGANPHAEGAEAMANLLLMHERRAQIDILDTMKITADNKVQLNIASWQDLCFKGVPPMEDIKAALSAVTEGREAMLPQGHGHSTQTHAHEHAHPTRHGFRSRAAARGGAGTSNTGPTF